MKKALVLLCVLLAGCAQLHYVGSPATSLFDGTAPVWKQAENPPDSVPAPPGFTVTPAQAYRLAWETHRLNQKYVAHLYADSQRYYVFQPFWGSNSSLAREYGLRIDGRSGRVTLSNGSPLNTALGSRLETP